MKLPVLHNFNVIKGETITLNVGYTNMVDSESLFACVRKYPTDEEYKAKFDVSISKEGLEDDELCKIILSLETNILNRGKYYWDLFLWSGNKPIKCLIKGEITICEGISNRGK